VDLFETLSSTAKQRVLDNYFKFIFVHHPLERLVSAHQDKFVDTRYHHHLNSWPTFSPYLYNRVCSELTTRNPLTRSHLACSRLSGHIQPSVNRWECEQTTYEWRCKPVKHNHSTSELQRSWIKLVRPLSTVKTLSTLVYSTVDCGLTITSFSSLNAVYTVQFQQAASLMDRDNRLAHLCIMKWSIY